MEVIEIIKTITGNDVNDVLLNYWIDKAVIVVNKYLNKPHTKEEALALYKNAIIQCVFNEYQRHKQQGVKAMSQGQRSVTYKDDLELEQSIKRLLPNPFMRLK